MENRQAGCCQTKIYEKSDRQSRKFCFKLSWIPVLVIHWPEIGLAVTRQSRPISRATHWAKSSRAQAGQLLVSQSAPLLV